VIRLKVKLRKILKSKKNRTIIENITSKIKLKYAFCEGEEVVMGNCQNYKRLKKRELEDIVENIVFYGDENADILYDIVTNFISQEIEKKWVVRETLDKYKELVIFYSLGEKISACMDLRQSLRIIYSEITKYIHATQMNLLFLGDDSKEVTSFINLPADDDIKVSESFSTIIEKVVEFGQSQIFNDVEGYLGDYKSLICAPIIQKNAVKGIVVIGNSESVAYSAEDLKLFNAAIFQLSISLENIKIYNALEELLFQTALALSETIEKRDPYTGGHTRRVMDLSVLIGEKLELTKDDIINLRLAALMHDVGKVGIEDNILRKPTQLSVDEFEQMKKHTIYGVEILQNIKNLQKVINGVRSHHERYDGKGYPQGLVGEDIPILARILCITDSYDAMISDRPYREGMSVKSALEELVKHSGAQFDPNIVRVFLSLFEKEKGDLHV
jgi:putative nucleotidyltransferase with HDIG domain